MLYTQWATLASAVARHHAFSLELRLCGDADLIGGTGRPGEVDAELDWRRLLDDGKQNPREEGNRTSTATKRINVLIMAWYIRTTE